MGLQPLVSTKSRHHTSQWLASESRQKCACLSQPTCPVEVLSLLSSLDRSPLSSPRIMAQRVEADLVMELTSAAPRRLQAPRSSSLEPGQVHLL